MAKDMDYGKSGSKKEGTIYRDGNHVYGGPTANSHRADSRRQLPKRDKAAILETDDYTD
jgi:hypothetical protein